MLLKNVDYDAFHFHTGFVENQHLQRTLLGGKEYSVYAFDNVDNSGRPFIAPVTGTTSGHHKTNALQE